MSNSFYIMIVTVVGGRYNSREILFSAVEHELTRSAQNFTIKHSPEEYEIRVFCISKHSALLDLMAKANASLAWYRHTYPLSETSLILTAYEQEELEFEEDENSTADNAGYLVGFTPLSESSN